MAPRAGQPLPVPDTPWLGAGRRPACRLRPWGSGDLRWSYTVGFEATEQGEVVPAALSPASAPLLLGLVAVSLQGEAGGRAGQEGVTEPSGSPQTSGQSAGPEPPPGGTQEPERGGWTSAGHRTLLSLLSAPGLTSARWGTFPGSSLTCPSFRERSGPLTWSHPWLISYSQPSLSPGTDGSNAWWRHRGAH